MRSKISLIKHLPPTLLSFPSSTSSLQMVQGDRERGLWSVHHTFLPLPRERSPSPVSLWGPLMGDSSPCTSPTWIHPMGNSSRWTASMWVTLLWDAVPQAQPVPVWVPHGISSPTRKPVPDSSLHRIAGLCQEPDPAQLSYGSQPPLRHLTAPWASSTIWRRIFAYPWNFMSCRGTIALPLS